MFFKDPILPRELIAQTLEYLSGHQQLDARLVCRDLWTAIDELGVLWVAAGAESHADFVERMRKLPPKLRGLVLSNVRYQLSTAEKIDHILSFHEEERISLLLNVDQIAALPNEQHFGVNSRDFHIHALTRDNGVIALCEGLITPAHAAAIRHFSHLNILLKDNGILALRKRFIVPEQVITIEMSARPHQLKSLDALMTDNGLVAWSEGLITLEQAITTCHLTLEDLLEGKNGITALRDKLITLGDAVAMPYPRLIRCLTSDDGILALRAGLITPREVAVMPGSPSDIERAIEARLLSAGLKLEQTQGNSAKQGL